MTQKQFDKVILILIILNMVIFNYFALTAVMNKIICALIGIRLLFNKTYNKSNNGLVVRVGILVLIALLNLAILGGDESIIASNLLTLIYSTIFVIYFCNVIYTDYHGAAKLLTKAFLPINAYYIINSLIMLRQIEDGSFMLAEAIYDLDFAPDLISGLMGFAATHEVALFTCFLVLYNICYARYYAKRSNWKWALTIYNIFMVIISIYITLENDNKVMFILLPFVLAWYFFFNGRTKPKVKSILVKGAAVVIAGIVLTCSSVGLDSFWYVLEIITDSAFAGNNTVGSGERIALPFFSLEYLNGWFLGNGLGSNLWFTPAFGFKHFGQSDFGTLIALGGIWFLISFIEVYRYMISKLLALGDKKDIRTSLLVITFIILVSVYTNLFTSTTKTIGFLLVISVFWLQRYILKTRNKIC